MSDRDTRFSGNDNLRFNNLKYKQDICNLRIKLNVIPPKYILTRNKTIS